MMADWLIWLACFLAGAIYGMLVEKSRQLRILNEKINGINANGAEWSIANGRMTKLYKKKREKK